MIYCLKHIDIEGPGTLGDFFREKGFLVKTIELYNGGPFPQNFDQMDAVVILGGPMNVYEETAYPFLAEETVFIRELIRRGILTVGLCLGAQLIARALGAKVYQSPVKEVGFFPLSLTSQGRKDSLFQGLSETMELFQWHEDTFDLPEGADLLLSGSECRNQAFRKGSNVYGFQCHMEVRREDALAWLEKYYQGDPAEYERMKKTLNDQFDFYEEKFLKTAQKFYNNLVWLIEARKPADPAEKKEQHD